MSEWKFIHVCDMQPGSPRSFRYRPADYENQCTAYAQIELLNPDLILVGGDLTRDGYIPAHDFEFEEARANLDAIGIPYHTIPGNMDVGNKYTAIQGPTHNDDLDSNLNSQNLERFARHFGKFPWSFVHRGVRFSGCYAAVAGSGLPEEQEFWNFLDGLTKEAPEKHHVFMMHYPLFYNSPDEDSPAINDPDRYMDWYFAISQPHRERIWQALKAANVEVVLSGHMHCRPPVQVVEGIRFYKAAATSFGQWPDRWPDGDLTLGFYEFTVSEQGIADRFVPLEKVSARTDKYGPPGHPRPELRDYSLAWEK